MLQSTFSSDDDLITQWLLVRMVSPNSTQSYMTGVRQFKEFVQKSLPEVTIHDMTRYLAFLQSKYKPSSVVTRLGTLRSLFAFAVEMGYVERNIAAQVQKPLVKDRLAEKILTIEQVERMIAAAKRPHEKALIRLAYTTGARVSELVSLKWRDFRPRDEGGQVTLFGKYGLTRQLLIHEPLWSDLMRMCIEGQCNASDSVFSKTRTTMWRIIKRAAVRAGLGWAASPHWLRHSHATHALHNGASLPLVREALGHRNLMATTKYLHAIPEESSSDYLKKV